VGTTSRSLDQNTTPIAGIDDLIQSIQEQNRENQPGLLFEKVPVPGIFGIHTAPTGDRASKRRSSFRPEASSALP
jgi:hypothetical protein